MGKHTKSEDLDDARDLLLDLALIRVRTEGTDGRHREMWSRR